MRSDTCNLRDHSDITKKINKWVSITISFVLMWMKRTFRIFHLSVQSSKCDASRLHSVKIIVYQTEHVPCRFNELFLVSVCRQIDQTSNRTMRIRNRRGKWFEFRKYIRSNAVASIIIWNCTSPMLIVAAKQIEITIIAESVRAFAQVRQTRFDNRIGEKIAGADLLTQKPPNENYSSIDFLKIKCSFFNRLSFGSAIAESNFQSSIIIGKCFSCFGFCFVGSLVADRYLCKCFSHAFKSSLDLSPSFLFQLMLPARCALSRTLVERKRNEERSDEMLEISHNEIKTLAVSHL